MLKFSEEQEKKTDEGEVFGCHYDEGRITRIVSEIETEQILAYQSTLSYPQLEKESGLHIFNEVKVVIFSFIYFEVRLACTLFNVNFMIYVLMLLLFLLLFFSISYL